MGSKPFLHVHWYYYYFNILVSVPNGTHDGRINCEHVCVRVGRNEMKKKRSLVIKVKFKKSSTRLNGRADVALKTAQTPCAVCSLISLL